MTTLRRWGRATAILVGTFLLATACTRNDESHAGHGAGLPVGSAPLTAATVPGEHAAHGGDASLPTGYAPVTIDPSRVAALGLRTALVAERDFQRTVRTVGVVALDETRTTHVHAKVRGWIDTLNLNKWVRRTDQSGATTSGGQGCAVRPENVAAQ